MSPEEILSLLQLVARQQQQIGWLEQRVAELQKQDTPPRQETT